MRMKELVNLWDRASVSLEFRDWSCFASLSTGVLLLSIYLYIGILYQYSWYLFIYVQVYYIIYMYVYMYICIYIYFWLILFVIFCSCSILGQWVSFIRCSVHSLFSDEFMFPVKTKKEVVKNRKLMPSNQGQHQLVFAGPRG